MAVGPGEAAKGGGFLTGWKGWVILASVVATAAILAGAGLSGSNNSVPTLAKASREFVGPDNDFGANLYNADGCILNSTTYARGDWEFTFPNVPDGDRNRSTSVIPLSNTDALVALGDVFPGRGNTPANYRYRPEDACFPVCREQLGARCTMFTYDGLTADSCRFLDPSQSPPAPITKVYEDEPDFYVYNATCMQEVRERFIRAFDQPAPGLNRPNSTATTPRAPNGDVLSYIQALGDAMVFLKAQWAGALPAGFNSTTGLEWKQAGFVNKGENCPENFPPDAGNFANGYHVMSTMATAEEIGVLSLARLWWRDAFGRQPDVSALAREEIGRQSVYLTNAWDAAAEEVLVGVGDQLDTNGTLLMYQDFGSAPFALQVGDNTTEFGQPTPVDPDCTYTSPREPAAAVAAHAAAALALGSVAVRNFVASEALSPEDMVEAAIGLVTYSLEKSPIERDGGTNGTDAAQNLGASQLYPINDDTYVHTHQLWATCALWQATGDEKWWNGAEQIYKTHIRKANFGPSQLFTPQPNYENPVFWALLCMAQSAPQYTGLEEEATLAVPEASVDDDRYLNFLLSQEFKRGSRAEATDQIWEQLVLQWLTQQQHGNTTEADRRIMITDDGFRYFDINGTRPDNPQGVPGMFRDVAGMAMASLMYADLPGISANQSFWARCMAKQSIDYILGDNPDEFSYVIRDGVDSPKNPFHLDAACPSAETRLDSFTNVFEKGAFNSGQTDSLSARLCDAITFQGAPKRNESDGSDQTEINDPIIDNEFTLIGAMVSSFRADPAGNAASYIDDRTICDDGSRRSRDIEEEPCDPVANPMAQVSIDSNAVLSGALAGIAALPASFFDTPCPSPAELRSMATQAFTADQNAPPVVAPGS